MWGVFAMVYYEIEWVPACGVQVGFYIYNFPSILSEDVVLFPTKLNGVVAVGEARAMLERD